MKGVIQGTQELAASPNTSTAIMVSDPSLPIVRPSSPGEYLHALVSGAVPGCAAGLRKGPAFAAMSQVLAHVSQHLVVALPPGWFKAQLDRHAGTQRHGVEECLQLASFPPQWLDLTSSDAEVNGSDADDRIGSRRPLEILFALWANVEGACTSTGQSVEELLDQAVIPLLDMTEPMDGQDAALAHLQAGITAY